MKKKLIIASMLALGLQEVVAQVGVGTTNPNASSVLDVTSTDKGLLIPRINLTGTNDVATIATPATSLLVYNQATVAGANAVVPGFYYFNGTMWVPFISGTSSGASKWTNNSANNRVELTNLSDGSTVRSADSSFVITDDSKLGLGTIAPTFKLHTYSEGVSTGAVFESNTAASAIGFVDSNTRIRPQVVYSINDLYFQTLALERMRIDSNGNVGIGTTTPTRGLDVATDYPQAAFGKSGQAGKILLRRTAGQETGIFGYRSATEQDTLDVFSQGGLGILQLGAQQHVGFTTGNTLQKSAERMRITQTGNIGMGTTNPTSELHVAATTPVLILQDTASTFSEDSYAGYLSGRDQNNSETWWVGEGSGGAKQVGLLASRPGYSVMLGTAGVERVRVDSLGNVGIGTSTPVSKLHVNEVATDSAGTHYSTYNRTTYDPVGAGGSFATTMFNQLSYMQTAGDDDNTGITGGAYALSLHAGSGDLTNHWASYSRADNINAGDVNSQVGAFNLTTLAPTSTGNITLNHGTFNFAQNNNATGTISSNYASYNLSENLNVGTITNSYGSYNQIDNDSTGTTLRAYGVFTDINQNQGTIGTAYGVYIDDATAVAQYGLYQTGTNDTNFFAGYVGLGTNSPQERLHIDANNDSLQFQNLAGTGNGLAIDASGKVYRANIATADSTEWVDKGDYVLARRAAQSADTVVVTDSGNIGIGIASPDAGLHIRKSGEFYLNLNSTGGARKPGIKFQRGEFATDGFTDWTIYNETGHLYFQSFSPSASLSDTLLTLRDDQRVGVGVTIPTSKLHVDGPVAKAIDVITAATLTLDDTHSTVILEPAGAMTVNLPAANTCEGRIYKFINRTANTATLNITYLTAFGSQNDIGGFSTIELQSSGTSWYQID